MLVDAEAVPRPSPNLWGGASRPVWVFGILLNELRPDALSLEDSSLCYMSLPTLSS
jgi:hypothetical protein